MQTDHRHGQNRNGPGAAKKQGGNKGIEAARRERKRVEAERRNAKTPPELRRAYRLRMADGPSMSPASEAS